MKTLKAFGTCLLAACILTGCSSSNLTDYKPAEEAAGNYAAEEEFKETGETETGYVNLEDYDEETNSFNGKKIIYTGYISLETKDYSDTVSEIEALIAKYNVIISSSDESDYNNTWYTSSYRKRGVYGKSANWTLRVPVQNFDAFIRDLSNSSAHVSNKNISSSDQTKRYSDNETKIKSLEIQRDRLLELLEQAQNVTEILEIEDRLTQVRYELEILNNDNNQIDYDVQYSSFTISLREVSRYSTDEYSFADRLGDAFQESFENFTDWIKDSIIFVVFALPFILLAAAVIFIINFIRKKKGKEPVRLSRIFRFSDEGKGISFWSVLKAAVLIVLIIFILLVIQNLI